MHVSFRSFFILIILLVSALSKVAAQADKDLVEIADETYTFGDKNDALEQYLLALRINPENLRANYMAGKVYIETTHKERSLKYLLKAYSMNQNIVGDILFLIAQSYHYGEDLDNAEFFYKEYESKIKNERVADKDKILKDIAMRIDQCGVAKTMIKNPLNVSIESLGASINTIYPEFGPAITSDETFLIFTSKRPDGTSNDKDVTNEYFEDIYYSNLVDGEWQPAQNIGHTINTSHHDASISLSADGKRLFLYKDIRNGDIYFSDRMEDDTWTVPERLGGEINSSSAEISISMAGDGKAMVFSSNRPGGQGGFDLFEVRADKKGNWGKPKNLGKMVNTPYDEESAFLSPDGKTLYFSSNGHPGMGGMDIFKSQWDEKKKQWGKPENLGYPINSVDNDIDFVISGSGKMAYYASVKEYGEGEKDIFRIDFEPKQKPVVEEKTESKPAEVPEVNLPVKLRVILKDQSTGEIITGKVQFGEKDKGSKQAMLKNDEGAYEFSLVPDAGKSYQVTAEKDGYIFRIVEAALPAGSKPDQVVNLEIVLKRIQAGQTTILRNIYFDFDKATLKPESNTELRKLENLLRENNSLRIQINGHTDRIGSPEYNKALSLKRSQSVVRHLTDRGIESTRIVAMGFGEEKPLASNDDEEDGRNINRRTEFTILNQ